MTIYVQHCPTHWSVVEICFLRQKSQNFGIFIKNVKVTQHTVAESSLHYIFVAIVSHLKEHFRGVPPSLLIEGSNLSEKLEAPNFPNSNLLGLQSVRISKKNILTNFYYIESTKMLFPTQIYLLNSNLQSKTCLRGCFGRNMVRFGQFCPFLFYFYISSAFLRPAVLPV